ncbi:MAG TPA: polysaccharide deacetylase family protein, partial [Candidatus Polarisedimenticolia bacterium]|nr:polysaccharide deacetylase family protein [Candidatus Polarisedimenticolia bacterium]
MSPSRGRAWPWMGRAASWSGIGPLAGSLWRRRAASTWTVLGYHRVGAAAPDGGPGVVAPERFRAQVRWLKQRYDVVTVGEAFAAMQGGGRARPMASLTFDDGYRDNVAVALPILLEEGCRATLYPTLEAIEEGKAPWPHRLSRALRRLAGSGTAVPASWPKGIADLAGPEPRAGGGIGERVAAVIALAKRLPASECARLCADVEALAGTGAGHPEMLSAADLRAWAAAGMEVGSHTHRHPVLSRQTPEERRADLLESRRGLERIAGTPVVHLAYPNGRTGDWDEAVVADARAAGYATAVTTIEGINRAGADPLRLLRVSVGDDEVAAFSLRLLPAVARRRA